MRGNRYDGVRLRNLDPFYQIIPYIMRTRADAQNSFEDSIDIGPAEEWIREQRKSGFPRLSLLHVVIAALVRTLSQRPRLNRFVAGRRIYARNQILISLALKRRLDEDSPETVVKIRFDPKDTVYDVARAVDAAVEESKAPAKQNEADRAARLFMLCPGFVVRALMWAVRVLDRHGLLPRALHRASPFHTSAFVTDLGSLGIRPIYHHLYEFGTTSLFLAFGLKERERVLDEDGATSVRRTVGIKVVTDERICDGYTYASAFKFLKGLFRRPAELAQPPAAVVEDTG